MPQVVYYYANNDEGYIWETIEAVDLPYFKNRGWCESPADLKPPEVVEDVKNEAVKEEVVEHMDEEVAVKKRGRPPLTKG